MELDPMCIASFVRRNLPIDQKQYLESIRKSTTKEVVTKLTNAFLQEKDLTSAACVLKRSLTYAISELTNAFIQEKDLTIAVCVAKRSR